MDMFEYYGLFREEHLSDRLTVTESNIIEHLFDKYLPEDGRVIDTSAGHGTFAFRFAEMGYEVTAGDLIMTHVNAIRANPRSKNLKKIYCSSPRNLSQFEDGSFDILISLGPVYHMKTRAERETFMRESTRVLSPNGYLAFTFMTPIAMTFGQFFRAMHTEDNEERLRAYRKLTSVEKSHSCDMFYGMTLEEMTDLSREFGLDIKTVAATYSMLYNTVDDVAKMNQEEYAKFIKCQIATCEDPFVARYCMRGLYIAQKKEVDMFD